MNKVSGRLEAFSLNDNETLNIALKIDGIDEYIVSFEGIKMNGDAISFDKLELHKADDVDKEVHFHFQDELINDYLKLGMDLFTEAVSGMEKYNSGKIPFEKEMT